MVAVAEHEGAEVAVSHGDGVLGRLIDVAVSKVAVFRDHEEAQPIALIEEEWGDGVVGHANGVATDFLQALEAPGEQAVGHGDAHARVILVHVYPLKLERLAVEEEAAFGAKTHMAHAEGRHDFVDEPVGDHDGAAQPVEDRVGRRPQLGIRQCDFLGDLDACGDAQLVCRNGAPDDVPLGVEDLVFDRHAGGRRATVGHLDLRGNCRIGSEAGARIVDGRGNKDAIRRDVDGLDGDEPDVAVNAASLVPPAVVARVDFYDKGVGPFV